MEFGWTRLVGANINKSRCGDAAIDHEVLSPPFGLAPWAGFV